MEEFSEMSKFKNDGHEHTTDQKVRGSTPFGCTKQVIETQMFKDI